MGNPLLSLARLTGLTHSMLLCVEREDSTMRSAWVYQTMRHEHSKWLLSLRFALILTIIIQDSSCAMFEAEA